MKMFLLIFFADFRMDHRVPMFIPRVALVSSSSCSSNQSSRHRTKSDWSEESCESEGFYAEKNRVGASKSRANRKKEIYFVHKGPKRTKAGSTHTTESSSNSSLSSSNRSNYVSVETKLNQLSLTDVKNSMNFHCQSVNSLLLSVENLENFNRTNAATAANKPNRLQSKPFVFDTNSDRKQQMMENIKSVLAVEDMTLAATAASPSMNGIEKKTTKDPDELSSRSSITTTNFTGPYIEATISMFMTQIRIYYSSRAPLAI